MTKDNDRIQILDDAAALFAEQTGLGYMPDYVVRGLYNLYLDNPKDKKRVIDMAYRYANEINMAKAESAPLEKQIGYTKDTFTGRTLYNLGRLLPGLGAPNVEKALSPYQQLTGQSAYKPSWYDTGERLFIDLPAFMLTPGGSAAAGGKAATSLLGAIGRGALHGAVTGAEFGGATGGLESIADIANKDYRPEGLPEALGYGLGKTTRTAGEWGVGGALLGGITGGLGHVGKAVLNKFKPKVRNLDVNDWKGYTVSDIPPDQPISPAGALSGEKKLLPLPEGYPQGLNAPRAKAATPREQIVMQAPKMPVGDYVNERMNFDILETRNKFEAVKRAMDMEGLVPEQAIHINDPVRYEALLNERLRIAPDKDAQKVIRDVLKQVREVKSEFGKLQKGNVAKRYAQEHRSAIMGELDAGNPVKYSVLRDYPDLLQVASERGLVDRDIPEPPQAPGLLPQMSSYQPEPQAQPREPISYEPIPQPSEEQLFARVASPTEYAKKYGKKAVEKKLATLKNKAQSHGVASEGVETPKELRDAVTVRLAELQYKKDKFFTENPDLFTKDGKLRARLTDNNAKRAAEWRNINKDWRALNTVAKETAKIDAVTGGKKAIKEIESQVKEQHKGIVAEMLNQGTPVHEKALWDYPELRSFAEQKGLIVKPKVESKATVIEKPTEVKPVEPKQKVVVEPEQQPQVEPQPRQENVQQEEIKQQEVKLEEQSGPEKATEMPAEEPKPTEPTQTTAEPENVQEKPKESEPKPLEAWEMTSDEYARQMVDKKRAEISEAKNRLAEYSRQISDVKNEYRAFKENNRKYFKKNGEPKANAPLDIKNKYDELNNKLKELNQLAMQYAGVGYDEMTNTIPSHKAAHRKIVEQALANDEPVPEKVLAEYPDLAKEYGRQISEAKSEQSNAKPALKWEDGVVGAYQNEIDQAKPAWDMTKEEFLNKRGKEFGSEQEAIEYHKNALKAGVMSGNISTNKFHTIKQDYPEVAKAYDEMAKVLKETGTDISEFYDTGRTGRSEEVLEKHAEYVKNTKEAVAGNSNPEDYSYDSWAEEIEQRAEDVKPDKIDKVKPLAERYMATLSAMIADAGNSPEGVQATKALASSEAFMAAFKKELKGLTPEEKAIAFEKIMKDASKGSVPVKVGYDKDVLQRIANLGDEVLPSLKEYAQRQLNAYGKLADTGKAILDKTIKPEFPKYLWAMKKIASYLLDKNEDLADILGGKADPVVFYNQVFRKLGKFKDMSLPEYIRIADEIGKLSRVEPNFESPKEAVEYLKEVSNAIQQYLPDERAISEFVSSVNRYLIPNVGRGKNVKNINIDFKTLRAQKLSDEGYTLYSFVMPDLNPFHWFKKSVRYGDEDPVSTLEEMGLSTADVVRVMRSLDKKLRGTLNFIRAHTPNVYDRLIKSYNTQQRLNSVLTSPLLVLRGRLKPEYMSDYMKELGVKVTHIPKSLHPYIGAISGDIRALRMPDETIAKRAGVSLEQVKKAREAIREYQQKVLNLIHKLHKAVGAPTAGERKNYLPISIKHEVFKQLEERRGKFFELLNNYFDKAINENKLIDPATGNELPLTMREKRIALKNIKVLKEFADEYYYGDMVNAYLEFGDPFGVGLSPEVYRTLNMDIAEKRLRLSRRIVLPHYFYDWKNWLGSATKYTDTATRAIAMYSEFGKPIKTRIIPETKKPILHFRIEAKSNLGEALKKIRDLNLDDYTVEQKNLQDAITAEIRKSQAPIGVQRDVAQMVSAIFAGGTRMTTTPEITTDVLTTAGLSGAETARKNVLLGMVMNYAFGDSLELARTALSALIPKMRSEKFANAVRSLAISSGERMYESAHKTLSKWFTVGMRVGEIMNRTTADSLGRKQLNDFVKKFVKVAKNKDAVLKGNIFSLRYLKGRKAMREVKAMRWFFNQMHIADDTLKAALEAYHKTGKLPQDFLDLAGKAFSDYTQMDVSIEHLPQWVMDTEFGRLLTLIYKTGFGLNKPKFDTVRAAATGKAIMPMVKLIGGSMAVGALTDYLRGGRILNDKEKSAVEKAILLAAQAELFGILSDAYRFLRYGASNVNYVLSMATHFWNMSIEALNMVARGEFRRGSKQTLEELAKSAGIGRTLLNISEAYARPNLPVYMTARANSKSWANNNVKDVSFLERLSQGITRRIGKYKVFERDAVDAAIDIALASDRGDTIGRRKALRELDSVLKDALKIAKKNGWDASQTILAIRQSVLSHKPIAIPKKYERMYEQHARQQYPKDYARWKKLDRQYMQAIEYIDRLRVTHNLKKKPKPKGWLGLIGARR